MRESFGCYDKITLPNGCGVIWEMARPWVPPQVDLPENPREALPGLVRFAAQVWDNICLVFGDSRKLVELGYVSRKTHALLGDWVRHLEGLARRIIIIAALTIKLAPVKLTHSPWGPGRHRRALWHDPTSWKVSFRLLPQQRCGGRWRKRTKKPPTLTRPAWRMAMRIEALRRVLSYPRGCALRLARTLQRIKARNVRANEPRFIPLSGWDFHPLRRTSGKRAVNTGMVLAQPLAEELWDAFWEPG